MKINSDMAMNCSEDVSPIYVIGLIPTNSDCLMLLVPHDDFVNAAITWQYVDPLASA